MLVLLCLTVSGAWAQTETLLITINSTSSFTSGSRTFNNIATVTFSSKVECEGDNDGWYNTGKSDIILSVTPAAGYTITKVKFYCKKGSAFDETSPFEATLKAGLMYVNGSSCGASGVNKIEVYGYAAPATVAVTGVTLAPTSATLTLGETETVTLIPTVLPAEATDKSVTWSSSNEAVATVTDGVVTAVAPGTATITATATNGTADTSDDVSATCAVTVSPAGYSVSLKSGTDDAANWQGKAGEGEYQALPLEGVAAGTAVSVKYNGTKKVKSVKARKKAATLSLTSPAKGQVIGSDGKNYAAAATLPTGVTKVAMIAYVSGSNGLAIALADEGKLNWATAKSTCEAKTPAFTNGTWHLPSQAEWNQMFSANGGDEERCYGLNAAINTAGGTALLEGGTGYWSSTPNGSNAWYVWLMDGDTDWRSATVAIGRQVRACLAF